MKRLNSIISICRFNLGNNSKRLFCSVQDRLKVSDKGQVNLMKEQLILVDDFDNKVGEISKLDGHLIEKKNVYPHRAFSLLLFDTKNRFIMHKRAAKKIIFPGMWTNACCSHPLATPEEEEPGIGIKRAVKRRVKIELNLDIETKDLLNVDKFIYRAKQDEMFEEYERKYY